MIPIRGGESVTLQIPLGRYRNSYASNASMHIRTFRNGGETALRAVFHSSVQALACKDYTAKQLDAWAPREYDAGQWSERIRGN